MSEKIPFAQTFAGAVAVALVGGLLVWWITKPTPIVPPEQSHPPPAPAGDSEQASATSPPLELALESLKHGNAADRSQAARSLASLSSQAADAVPTLIVALDDRVPSVRASVAEALGDIGADALPALERLKKGLEDPSPEVVSQAAWALGKIGASDAVPELRALLFRESHLREYGTTPRLNAEQRRLVCEALTALEGKVYQCW